MNTGNVTSLGHGTLQARVKSGLLRWTAIVGFKGKAIADIPSVHGTRGQLYMRTGEELVLIATGWIHFKRGEVRISLRSKGDSMAGIDAAARCSMDADLLYMIV